MLGLPSAGSLELWYTPHEILNALPAGKRCLPTFWQTPQLPCEGGR